MDNLDRLIEKVYACDNLACFIEREEILFANREATEALPIQERYLHEANLLFDGLSTPIEPEDVFAGRMIEACWPHSEPFSRLPGGIRSSGHITLPISKILSVGLDGMMAEITANAKRIGSEEAIDAGPRRTRLRTHIDNHTLCRFREIHTLLPLSSCL